MKMLNIYRFSQLLLLLETASQITVVATEAISNTRYKGLPISPEVMGFSGQSLLVIIVAVIIMIISALILRNLGRVLVNTSWKMSISCVGFSVASIAFRAFSSSFLVSPSSPYYVVTYNITSYFILIGLALWIPFGFCNSDKYQPPPSPDSERHRIRSTGGNRASFTHRPHQDDDNQSIVDGQREALPSYYEMLPPPTYKNANRQISRNGNRDSSASAQDVDTYVHNDTTEPFVYPEPNNNDITPSINNDAAVDEEGDEISPPPSINAVYMQDNNEHWQYQSSVVINIDENSSAVPDNNSHHVSTNTPDNSDITAETEPNDSSNNTSSNTDGERNAETA